MEQKWVQMGMPITVKLVDAGATVDDIAAVRDWFGEVDETFSMYKSGSQISLINTGKLHVEDADEVVRQILDLCEQTSKETQGYFSIETDEGIDPSGLVKGWAIERAAQMLKMRGRRNFFVEAGGDVATAGFSESGQPWRIGIRHPWQHENWVKVLSISDGGVATSGTAARGQHIVDPHTANPPEGIVSLTVIGPNIYEADRMATAAFAMGVKGLDWLEQRPGLEGYMIDEHARARWTEGFEKYVVR